jgi:hypothetical protein
VLDLCGIDLYGGMQGTSLAPVLADNNAVVRNVALIEEDEMFDLAGLGQPLRMRTIRTPDLRYTRYQGTDHGELYDLVNDPHEMENRFQDDGATHLRRQAEDLFVQTLLEHADEGRRPTHMA